MENDPEFDVVAINDLTDAEQLAYLLKYDTSHRRYGEDVSFEGNDLIVDSKRVKVYSETDPANLPWRDLDVDIVFECTGHFTDKDKTYAHINAGAKKVIISAPAKGELKTIVYNVNENTLDGTEEVISAASCTTNCLAPVLRIMDYYFKIKKGYMTTVHAYTNDQATLDIPHKKGILARRGRAAAANIVPTSTGAASAIGEVLPNLKGKLDGTALRVPVTDGSVVDLTLELEKHTTVEEINKAFEINQSETLAITNDPVVSSDIIGTTYGALVDANLTSIVEVDNAQLVKVVAWYDNEFGYSSQMVRLAKYVGLNMVSKD
jgi:glyceraldehyde 3-phosphate dehydrogenase